MPPRRPQTPAGRISGWRRLLTALLGTAGVAGGAGGVVAATGAPPAAPPQAPSPSQPSAAVSAGAGPAAPARAGASLPMVQAVAYKQLPGQRLMLNIVRPAADRFPGPRPAIVFFHGGGWRNGSPNQFRAFCDAMAEIGVVGISAQYRLMRGDERLPHDAVRDARSALRYVKTHAAALGIDRERVGAGGGSSGGHLAVMTALDTRFDDPADDLKQSPRPAALFLMNPPLDLDGYDSPVPQAQRRELSPLHLLGPAGLPPTIIFQGAADQVVPASQAQAFRERALSLGAKDVTLELFKGRTHGFFNAKRGEGKDFDKTVAGMTALLQRLGWVAR